MKRIMYISTQTEALPNQEIKSIGRIASQNNKRIGVTGVLLSAHEFFFQILEGDAGLIDPLVEVIRRDPRHKDLLILKADDGVSERLFPNWSMRMIRLEAANGLILQAVRIMLENITQSHRIIERYTQPAVLALLTQGVNPLEIPPKKADRVILFGDIVGFSSLSQKFPVDEVTEVVNAYLDVSSRRITEFGGEVSKYIGDCVMAHFPTDHIDAAIECCLSILQDVRGLRESAAKQHLIRFLYCGFGLASGQVIEGNIGSTIKMDYTILGDPVNLASRLEALTRTLQRAIAMSAQIREAARCDWPFQSMGQFHLKGQDAACTVYSLDTPLVRDFRGQQELAEEMGTFCPP